MNSRYFNSIIVCAFNEEENIFQCLSSIEKAVQKIINYEVLVINNGSSDNTNLKIKDFFNNSSKIFVNNLKVFNIDHVGLSEARNFGIKECNGAFISFVDADAYAECRSFWKDDADFYESFDEIANTIIAEHIEEATAEFQLELDLGV